MAEPLRHRQTKGAETDMPSLPPPRHIPTLPCAAKQKCHGRPWPFIGIDPDFASRRQAVARHQVVPCRQCEKTVLSSRFEKASKPAWQLQKIRISVEWHQATLASSIRSF